MTFTVVLFSIMGFLIIVSVVFLFVGGNKPAKDIVVTDDELIIDPITGNAVSIDELMETAGMELLDDTKIEKVYSSLSEEIRNRLKKKDVEDILEMHYQLIQSETEEPKADEDAVKEMIFISLQRKGKKISPSDVDSIVAFAYPDKLAKELPSDEDSKQ
jgi:hypothetical protein